MSYRRCRGVLVIALGCVCCGVTPGPADERTDGNIGVQLFRPIAIEAPAGNAGVFVGVCRFDNDEGLPTLSYATHDAIELAYLFAFELQLIPPRNCHLLLSGDAVSDTVKGHLEQLRKAGARVSGADRSRILLTLRQVKAVATADDQVLVCALSSHGFDDRGSPYVMPSDGVRDLLAETAVPLQTIELMLQESQAGHRLLLVDACQERLSAKTIGDGGTGQPLTAAFATALQQPTGQAKLASCSPREFSFEHGSLGGIGHGVFTWEVLQALRGGALADEQNIVRLGAVADYVAMHVTAWTTENKRPKQTPFLSSPRETERLPLAVKADDLTTLLATIEKQPLSTAFTADLRTSLVAYLRTLKAAEGADRELLGATRSFLNGQLPPGVFAGYVRQDQSRWTATTAASVRPKVTLPAMPGVTPMPTVPANPLPTPTPSAPPAESPIGKQAGEVRTFTIYGVPFCWCPAGSFTMGSPPSEEGRYDDEAPARVTLSRGFWMGRTEVTQGQWQSVMGSSPWKFEVATVDGNQYHRDGPDYPAVFVDLGMDSDGTAELGSVSQFCQVLTTRDQAAGRLPSDWRYRLPTEAEWEYACRAGTTGAYNGDGTGVLSDYAWYERNADGAGESYAHAVAQKKPNNWGLFDMHGNVREWCLDGYGEELLGGRNPFVSRGGLERVLRGGSWSSAARVCRSASRTWNVPSFRNDMTGFRLILSPSEPVDLNNQPRPRVESEVL